MTATAREKRLTLVAAILGSAIVFIDGTVVNVALPAIRADLDAGLATQQWIVEAYLLTLGSLILIGGSLSDLFGRRRVFVIGTAAFGATSLVCAVAPTAELLAVARGLQGAAGALLVPSSLAVIVATFDEAERGKAIGSWTAWSGVSTLVGPLAGGALVDVASWRWVFVLGLVPVAGALYLARSIPGHVDETRDRHIDVAGALLGGLGLAGPVLALILQPTRGFGDPAVWGPLAGGILLLALFVRQERRSPDPMMPLGLFRNRNFAYGNVATLLIYAGLGSSTFFLTLYLQQVAGYSAVAAGLSLVPVTVILFLLSSRFGALADRYGPRAFMAAGPVIGGLGLLLLVPMGSDVPLSMLIPGVCLFGLGLALTVAPLTAAVLGGVDEENAGIASGVNNAVARVAGLLAIAGVGALLSAQFSSTLDDRLRDEPLGERARGAVSTAKTRPMTLDAADRLEEGERRLVAGAAKSASVDGFRVAIGASAALMIAGGLISAAGIQNPRRRVDASDCPGGAICGASRDVAHEAAS